MLPCFFKKKAKDHVVDDDEDLDFDESVLKEPPLHRISHGQLKTAPHSPAPLDQRFIFWMIATLTPLLALPVLLFFLLQSPPPLERVTFWGISYYKLFFCFLIAAVSLTVSSILFFRTHLPLIAAIFISSLFCSIPLIVGIRYDLTVQQAILDIAFFADWPYFLHPFFIYVSLLLPAGILIYLTLQIQSIFSRKNHNYVFTGAAAFLATALFLGSYELTRAGTPNLLSFLHSSKLQSSASQVSSSPEQVSQELNHEEKPGPLTGKQLEFPPTMLPEEPALPITKNTTMAANNYETLPTVVLTDNTEFANIGQEGPNFAGEAARLEERLTTLLDEINNKIIKLSQLKSAIDTQQQTDLAALNNRIELLSQKTDKVLEQLDLKSAKTDQLSTNVPGVDPKNGLEATKTFSSRPNNSTLVRVSEQLDFLTRKVKTIQNDENSTTAPE